MISGERKTSRVQISETSAHQRRPFLQGGRDVRGGTQVIKKPFSLLFRRRRFLWRRRRRKRRGEVLFPSGNKGKKWERRVSSATFRGGGLVWGGDVTGSLSLAVVAKRRSVSWCCLTPKTQKIWWLPCYLYNNRLFLCWRMYLLTTFYQSTVECFQIFELSKVFFMKPTSKKKLFLHLPLLPSFPPSFSARRRRREREEEKAGEKRLRQSHTQNTKGGKTATRSRLAFSMGECGGRNSVEYCTNVQQYILFCFAFHVWGCRLNDFASATNSNHPKIWGTKDRWSDRDRNNILSKE